PRSQVRAVHAVMRELDPGQRPAVVNGGRNLRQSWKVAVIPDAQLDERRDVGGRVDLHLLGTHDGPATLRLDPPHGGLGPGIAVSHPRTVGDLEEPVLGGDRPDLHRFEEDIVPGVAQCSAFLLPARRPPDASAWPRRSGATGPGGTVWPRALAQPGPLRFYEGRDLRSLPRC